jgi:hypothetical protein
MAPRVSCKKYIEVKSLLFASSTCLSSWCHSRRWHRGSPVKNTPNPRFCLSLRPHFLVFDTIVADYIRVSCKNRSQDFTRRFVNMCWFPKAGEGSFLTGVDATRTWRHAIMPRRRRGVMTPSRTHRGHVVKLAKMRRRTSRCHVVQHVEGNTYFYFSIF